MYDEQPTCHIINLSKIYIAPLSIHLNRDMLQLCQLMSVSLRIIVFEFIYWGMVLSLLGYEIFSQLPQYALMYLKYLVNLLFFKVFYGS